MWMLPYVLTVKSTVEILQKFVAFSEYMNFNTKDTVHWPSLDETLSKCIFVQNAPHMRKLEKSAC